MNGKEIAEMVSVEQNHRTARGDVRKAINTVESALTNTKAARISVATHALKDARGSLIEAEDAIESNLDEITRVYSAAEFKVRVNEIPADSPHNVYDIRVEVIAEKTGQRHTFDCAVIEAPETEPDMPAKVEKMKPSGSYTEDGNAPQEHRSQRPTAMLTAYDVLTEGEGYAAPPLEDVCVRPE